MCGLLGPSPGESWLAHMGIPDNYPRISGLSHEIDNAMWDAALAILSEWKQDDPLLRVMADERCTLWTWAEMPAGILPLGTWISVTSSDGEIYRGQLRPRDKYDTEQWGRDRLGVNWQGRVINQWYPDITPERVVAACVPVPFDMSALLAEVDREAGVANQPEPPHAPSGRDRLTKNQRDMLARALRDGEVPVPAQAHLSRRTATSLVRKGLLRRATGERWGATYRPTEQARERVAEFQRSHDAVR